MSSKRAFCVLGGAIALFSMAVLPGWALAAADDLPRYDLLVGRVLSYSDESTSKNADGSGGLKHRTNVRATVVAANVDGSRRVVIRRAFTTGVFRVA